MKAANVDNCFSKDTIQVPSLGIVYFYFDGAVRVYKQADVFFALPPTANTVPFKIFESEDLLIGTNLESKQSGGLCYFVEQYSNFSEGHLTHYYSIIIQPLQKTCCDLTLFAFDSFINRLFHYSLTLDQLNQDLLYR